MGGYAVKDENLEKHVRKCEVVFLDKASGVLHPVFYLIVNRESLCNPPLGGFSQFSTLLKMTILQHSPLLIEFWGEEDTLGVSVPII